MALPCAVLLLLTFFIHSVAASNDTASTVYEVLEEYGFPIGLLPKGVTSYKLDNSTGNFSVHLNVTCTFTIDSYKLKYQSTITGVITKDKLSNLSGIKVKILFFWINIVEVRHHDDELEFSVGIASADFPVNNFYECPTCGCGFDCDDVNSRKIEMLKDDVVSSY